MLASTKRTVRDVETRNGSCAGGCAKTRASMHIEFCQRSCHDQTYSLQLDIQPKPPTKQPTISRATSNYGDSLKGFLQHLGSAFATPTVPPRESGVRPWDASHELPHELPLVPVRGPAKSPVVRIAIAIGGPPRTIVSPFLTILSTPDSNSCSPRWYLSHRESCGWIVSCVPGCKGGVGYPARRGATAPRDGGGGVYVWLINTPRSSSCWYGCQ